MYCYISYIKMNKTILSLALIAITTLSGIYLNADQSVTDEQLFAEWKEKLALTFDERETVYRFKIFQQNLGKIAQHNSKSKKTHEQGINQFVFLTSEEFAAKYLSPMTSPVQAVTVEETPDNGPTVDWVSYGAVSPVKSQGSCTATYAFSAIGAIEGVSVIFYKTQQQYSVQQLIDCSQPYGNNGCNNGRMDFSFNYIKDKGINTWATYPYIGSQGTCKFATGLFKISGYANVTDCTTLANALTVRPISVAVDGNNFQFYKSGVFSNCGTNLSLAVLLVGMTDSFWNLKNSWGTTWGEAGYIRISRGNTCGVCQVASFPTI